MRPHRWQPTRLHRPWDSPGKNTGMGCHFLLQCMKVKSESEVAQSCLTLSDPMDCSPPGSSIHGFSRQEYWRGVPLPCILYCAFYHLIHALLLASSWPSPSLPSHPPPFTAYIPLILKYLLITKTMMSLFMVQAFVHAMQMPLLSVHVWLPLAIFQSSA